MKVTFSPAALDAAALLVVVVTKAEAFGSLTRQLDEASGQRLSRQLAAHLDGKVSGDVIEMFAPTDDIGSVLVLVLPAKEPLPRSEVEAAGGKLAQALQSRKVREVSLLIEPIAGLSMDEGDLAAALVSGLQLRSYRFQKYQKDDDQDRAPPIELVDVRINDRDRAGSAYAAARAQVRGVERARDLVSEPANVLYPESFAERCRQLEHLGIAVELLDDGDMHDKGMGAILGVGLGSAKPPYIALMRWNGTSEDAAPIALVGKGICFDTGGISLKPGAGMEEMKTDMAGAAAVFGTMVALAERKARCHVVGALALAENMPSATAQRPGDVVTSYSGTTIEVVNTDAEGRLVLADTLAYVCDRFKPSKVVDLATLTGAVIAALGKEMAGLFANDEELANELMAASETTGERLWRLPLGEAYVKHIKSDIADIKNVGRGREAGSTAGAVFLQQFVGQTPWAHLDIAGVAWSSRDLALSAKGATGFGVRLLDHWLSKTAES
ncbi:MAG: leucyl aminopeptidase [Geminicoccaceae bacterium]